MSRTSPIDLDEVIAAAQADRLSDFEIAELARALANSGEVLERRDDHADVASTGGPSSLSTLLCPLYLHALGARVAKLGVAGRPAGGVDVLATVPGFRPTLKRAEVEAALRSLRHVHLAAGGPWAPMDAELFKRRQGVGAQQVASLVIASLLAKKVALGVVSAGLDVRVASHGNFGSNLAVARANASRFIAVARLLGMQAVCFLTDAARPYQPYIGRGEALHAITAVVEDRADGALAAHASDCLRMAARSLGVPATGIEGRDLASTLDVCLRAQGASLEALFERERAVATEPHIEHLALRTGRVSYDLQRLRDVLVTCQKRDQAGLFADPAGVVLEAVAGSMVQPGQLLMTIRVKDGDERLAGEIASCVRITDDGELPARRSALLEVVAD